MSPFISRPGYHISQGTRVSAKSHEDFRFSYLFVNSVKILLSLAYPSPLFYLSHCLVFFSPVVSTVVEERRCLIHSNAVRVPLYRSLNTVARDNVSENFRTVRPTNCFFPFCFCFLYRSPFFFEESDRVSFDPCHDPGGTRPSSSNRNDGITRQTILLWTTLQRGKEDRKLGYSLEELLRLWGWLREAG